MHANSTCECVFSVLCSQSLWDEYWGMLCVLVGLCDCIVSEKGKPVFGKQHMAHNAHKTTTTTDKRHKQQQPHHIIIINIINAYDMQLHSCANSLTQHRQSMTTLRRLSFIAYRINVDEKIIGCHTHNEAMPIFSQRRETYWMKNKWIELFISRKSHYTRCGHWTHTQTTRRTHACWILVWPLPLYYSLLFKKWRRGGGMNHEQNSFVSQTIFDVCILYTFTCSKCFVLIVHSI